MNDKKLEQIIKENIKELQHSVDVDNGLDKTTSTFIQEQIQKLKKRLQRFKKDKEE